MRTAAVLLAYETEDVKPGWVAFVLVLALVVATFLLWRSMNKQLRKIDVPTRQEIRDAARGEAQHGDTQQGDTQQGETQQGETDVASDEEKPAGS